MTAFTASPIAGAPAAITLQIAIIPSPTFVRTAGIKPAIPVTITVSAATIAVAPAAPAVASAVNPIASEESPVPAATIQLRDSLCSIGISNAILRTGQLLLDIFTPLLSLLTSCL